MDSQKQIVEFLSKPENLPIALEVSKHIEGVRNNLQKSFWHEITKALDDRISQTKLGNRWYVDLDTSISFDDQWENCGIYLKNLPEHLSKKTLSISLMQNSKRDNYQLCYGLCWYEEHKNKTNLDVFKKLMQLSEANGIPPTIPEDKWWPTRINLDIYTRSDDFVLQYGLDQTGFIKDLSGSIWGYFEIIEADLYLLNKGLLKS